MPLDPVGIFKFLTLLFIQVVNLIKQLREQYPNAELLTDADMSAISRATHSENLARAQQMQQD